MRMNVWTALGLLCGFAGWLSLVNTGEASDSYTSSKGFTIQYPSGWVPMGKEAPAIPEEFKSRLEQFKGVNFEMVNVLFANPREEGFRENMHILIVPGKNPLDNDSPAKARQSAEQVTQQLGARLGEFKSEIRTIGGRQALYTIYDMVSDLEPVKAEEKSDSFYGDQTREVDDEKEAAKPAPAPKTLTIRQVQIIFPGKRQSYIMTCTARADEFSTVEPLFHQAAITLSIDEGFTAYPGWLTGGVFGGAIGAVIGLIVFLIRKLMQPLPVPA